MPEKFLQILVIFRTYLVKFKVLIKKQEKTVKKQEFWQKTGEKQDCPQKVGKTGLPSKSRKNRKNRIAGRTEI